MKENSFFVALLLIVQFSSCTVIDKALFGNTYEYKYEWLEHRDINFLNFDDGRVVFHFSITNDAVHFTLINKTYACLYLIWDKVSFTQYGNTEKVIHKEIEYKNWNASQPATTILSYDTLSNMIIPVSKIYNTPGYVTDDGLIPETWNRRELFPTHNSRRSPTRSFIKRFDGQEITIFIPLRSFEGQELGYSFTFKATVICATCSSSKK